MAVSGIAKGHCTAGGLFGSNRIQRAVKVQRRFRRAFGKDGSRIVEGLEIVKTFRVMDGIAGTEMPTSTTKSSLRLTRPAEGTAGATGT